MRQRCAQAEENIFAWAFGDDTANSTEWFGQTFKWVRAAADGAGATDLQLFYNDVSTNSNISCLTRSDLAPSSPRCLSSACCALADQAVPHVRSMASRRPAPRRTRCCGG